MIEEIKNIKSTISDFRKFGITVGVALIVIAGFLFWRNSEAFDTFFVLGILLCLLGIAMPAILKPVYWVWMLLAIILGWIMTHVILSLLFYVVITPIGLLLRLFGIKFMDMKWDRSEDTYWNDRTKNQRSMEDYERQF